MFVVGAPSSCRGSPRLDGHELDLRGGGLGAHGGVCDGVSRMEVAGAALQAECKGAADGTLCVAALCKVAVEAVEDEVDCGVCVQVGYMASRVGGGGASGSGSLPPVVATIII